MTASQWDRHVGTVHLGRVGDPGAEVAVTVEPAEVAPGIPGWKTLIRVGRADGIAAPTHVSAFVGQAATLGQFCLEADRLCRTLPQPTTTTWTPPEQEAGR